MQILVFGPILLDGLTWAKLFTRTQNHPKKVGKFPSSSTHISKSNFSNYLNCIEKGQKEHTKCYMISNPTSKFTSQIRSIRSVFGRNRTGTGSEKIDRIDRNRISGRTLGSINIIQVTVYSFTVHALKLMKVKFCLFLVTTGLRSKFVSLNLLVFLMIT